jgi:hypothetical protein
VNLEKAFHREGRQGRGGKQTQQRDRSGIQAADAQGLEDATPHQLGQIEGRLLAALFPGGTDAMVGGQPAVKPTC